MHEARVAADILETVERVAADNFATRITSIRLQIGEFTCVQPDALQFCLEALSEGTIAQDAALSITRIKTTAVCGECHSEFSVHEIEFRCPMCASTNIELLSGRELFIESIEVD
ncbi:MAG: hydrogenase maturation nickel metallochaperone HypA [Candidatus Coatesbacteria bacterium]|nr:hydrogenase maturation nickel metallochaperone HypA [Candidatus Coatesbacteria bacterium]